MIGLVASTLLMAASAVVHAAPSAADPAASKPVRTKAVRSADSPKPLPRKRFRSTGVAPGATGGTPEASARTPGGPPPDVKEGLTFPLPDLKR